MPWVISIFTTAQEAQARMQICKACPELTPRQLCKQCGCIVPAKVRLRRTSCPMNKWGPIFDNGQQHFVDDKEWSDQESAENAAKSRFLDPNRFRP